MINCSRIADWPIKVGFQNCLFCKVNISATLGMFSLPNHLNSPLNPTKTHALTLHWTYLLTCCISRFNISHPSQDVTIPVSAFIKHPDAMGKLRQLAQEEGEEGEFGIWVPDDPIFDASVVVTLLIACLTVALGSLWSGYVKHHLRLKLQEQSEALPRHRYNTLWERCQKNHHLWPHFF